MAAGGGLTSELYPTGVAVCCQPAFPAGSLAESTGSCSAEAPPSPTESLLPGGLAPVHREQPKEGFGEGPGSRTTAVAPPGTTVRPKSTAEPPTSMQHHQGGAVGTNNSLIESLHPACTLPVQRSHSDTLQGDACGPTDPAHHGHQCNAQSHQRRTAVTCKQAAQAMQLQHCGAVPAEHPETTQCLQGGPAHMCVPRRVNVSEEVVGENHHQQQQCEEPLRYSNHGNVEDSFAAYCHLQPTLATAQRPSLRMLGTEVQPENNLLALPRLVSSVSETGLDSKRLLGCCDLNCSWNSPFPPGGGFHAWGEECSRPADAAAPPHQPAWIRDVGTMTVRREVRDVGVQTGLCTPPHVFPRVCLARENGGDGDTAATAGSNGSGHAEAGGGDGQPGPLKAPVQEVKWDAEGMTWEVYGASVDPQELGLAIQRHLELQIKETAGRAARALSRQGTGTSRQSAGKGCAKKRDRVRVGLFRPPACCARTTTAVD